MFEISRRADYAMRIMIELGHWGEGVSVSARELSRRTAVPKAFLHKITADLVKASLVSTFPGAAGGLALAQPATAVTALHIIEAIEGPICVNVCLVRPHECPRDRLCPAHDLWGRIQGMIVAELQSTTLADLAAEAKSLKKRPRPATFTTFLFPESRSLTLVKQEVEG